MFVDLHAHYPMHVIPPERRDAHERLKAWRRERLRTMIVRFLSRWFNYQGPRGEPSVTLDRMREGDVGVIFSALYEPFDEIDLDERYGAPPRERYFDDLLAQIKDVEDDIARHQRGGVNVAIARSPQELSAALAEGKQVLIHSLEGGFHLGPQESEIARHVAELARRGVVCITVAHLFWRGVATNSPALPFMSDRCYERLFPQPGGEGLSELGSVLVTAMVDEGILIDITHMSERAIADTFALLDHLDGERPIPVVATHMACRFGALNYNLSEEAIRRVGQRGGLLGLIACARYVSDGEAKPESFEDSIRLLRKHIDRICDITGSTDHVAFGSDLDGYIKPALPGIEHLGRMRALHDALVEAYGATTAEKFTSGNALRVLESSWRGGAAG